MSAHYFLVKKFMFPKTKIIKVATHDGFFHADEIFALAVLNIYFDKVGKEMEIIRTRDSEKIANLTIKLSAIPKTRNARNKTGGLTTTLTPSF